MGVIMGKIVEVNGIEVELVLQGLDEEDLIKQVDVINEMERKAKAFDEISKIFDVYLGNVEDELNALNLIREKIEDLEDE